MNKFSPYKITHLTSITLITLLTLIVYCNTFKNGFVYDDHLVVEKDFRIRDWRFLPDILSEGRPIKTLAFSIDYHLWGLTPPGYHLTNTILHIISSILVYLLIYYLFINIPLAFFTGLFFAVHPVHIDAVSMVANRKDILALIFSLLSFICYIKKNKHFSYFIFSFLFYLLALFSKEVAAIGLPVMLIYYDFFLVPDSICVSLKKKLIYPIPFIIIPALSFFFICIKLNFFSAKNIFIITKGVSESYSSIFFSALKSILYYTKLSFFPINLSADHSFLIAVSILEPEVYFTICLLLAIIFIIKNNKSKVLSFALLWFFINLLPVVNFIPTTLYFSAERYLYTPSLGFCFLFAVILYNCKIGCRWYKYILYFIIIIIYSIITISGNFSLKNDYTLWSKVLKQDPKNYRGYNGIGAYYFQSGNYGKAISSFNKAKDNNSLSGIAYYKLGRVYAKLGNHKLAIKEFNTAIRIQPEDKDAYNSRGITMTRLKKYSEALEDFNRAIQINSSFANAYNNRGIVFARLKKNQLAILDFNKTIEINPNHTDAYYNRGIVNNSIKKYNQAISDYTKAIEIVPNHSRAYNNLGNVKKLLGFYNEALSAYKQALKIDPDFTDAYRNIGTVYTIMGNAELSK